MEKLTNYIKKIAGFYELTAARQIKYLVYYFQTVENSDVVTAKDIRNGFDYLHLNPYSNISAYLKKASQKGQNQEFLSKKTGVILIANLRHQIDQEIGKVVEVTPTDSLYPLIIFSKTPTYLSAFAEEATISYDYSLYNSCLFMLRKICEILIIELFESKGLQESIKTPNGDYYQLADLIKAAVTEKSWKFSKIVKENLPKIKLLADSSVHSKRFKARKSDIDPMKTDLRIIFEEFITLIDYPIKK